MKHFSYAPLLQAAWYFALLTSCAPVSRVQDQPPPRPEESQTPERWNLFYPATSNRAVSRHIPLALLGSI